LRGSSKECDAAHTPPHGVRPSCVDGPSHLRCVWWMLAPPPHPHTHTPPALVDPSSLPGATSDSLRNRWPDDVRQRVQGAFACFGMVGVHASGTPASRTPASWGCERRHRGPPRAPCPVCCFPPLPLLSLACFAGGGRGTARTVRVWPWVWVSLWDPGDVALSAPPPSPTRVLLPHPTPPRLPPSPHSKRAPTRCRALLSPRGPRPWCGEAVWRTA
jgi:hypothetical protein